MLKSEDLPGHLHHASLDALLDSTRTCEVCDLILHAAVSNYRRSLEAPVGTHRWGRFETVHAPENSSSNILHRAAYVKGFGPCMPRMESDCRGGGYFQPTDRVANWNPEFQFGRTALLSMTDMTERTDEKPVEDEALDLVELKKEIPKSYGVWLYGNIWVRHGSDGSNLTDLRYVGVGARFGSSGHIFHSINNTKGDVLIRGSALAICVEGSKLPFSPQPWNSILLKQSRESSIYSVA